MSQANSLERLMLELINAERAERGIPPLQLELRLNDSAEDHSQWMLEQDVFSHTGAGGSSAGERMTAANFDFSGSWTWGENIALQSERGALGLEDDVADLHASLMNSPGHRANILNPDFEVIGIGIERGEYNSWDAVIVTQNFAATDAAVQIDGVSEPAPAPAPAPAPTPEPAPAPAPIPEPTPDPDRGMQITGTGGRDRLTGGNADDVIVGRGDSDLLEGEAGDDLLKGNGGWDRLAGGAGADDLRGGRGSDRAEYLDAPTGLRADLANPGANTGHAAGDSYNSIERLLGSRFGDELGGDGGANRISGHDGDDLLVGRGGDDRLSGGKGDDILAGQQGDDILFGKGGADIFVFQPGGGADVVKDFRQADTLDFSSFGISSLDELLDRAEQVGSDTLFDLGGGNTVLIEDVILSQIEDSLVF